MNVSNINSFLLHIRFSRQTNLNISTTWSLFNVVIPHTFGVSLCPALRPLVQPCHKFTTHVLRLWSLLPVHQPGLLWKSLIALVSTLHFRLSLKWTTHCTSRAHQILSPSRSPPVTRGSSSSPSSLSPLSSSFTRSFFHSDLKTCLFGKFHYRPFPHLYQTDSTDSLPI